MSRTTSLSTTPGSSSARAAPVKGMSLTAKGGKTKSLEDALVKEDKLAPVRMVSKAAAAAEAVVVPQPTVQQPIMLVVAERLCCKMTRDGMVESFEIKGSLTLTAMTDEAALCSVQLAVSSANTFTFNTHPKVNKALYDQSSLLQLKDATKGFPAARPVGILKWTYASTADDLIPIKINCWPEEESRGQMNVSIEYSMDQDIVLHDVRIHIPLGTSEAPGILSADGAYKHNASSGELLWEINLIDKSNASGSLEFNIAQKDADAFFPIVVQFSSQQLYCNVQVSSVRSATDNTPIQYGLSKSMSTEEYTVG